MYNDINLKPFYLDKNDLIELNIVVDNLIEYLAKTKWSHREHDFQFSALKRVYTTQETEQNHDFVCQISSVYDPVLTMKDYKSKHFLGINATQTHKLSVWHLDKKYTISELQENKTIRQIVFNEVLHSLKAVNKYISTATIALQIEQFKNAFSYKYHNESIITLDSTDSIIANVYSGQGLYIETLEELYNYILAQPETYQQIKSETKLFFNDPLLFLYRQIGETAVNMATNKLNRSKDDLNNDVYTFLKSDTINKILSSPYRKDFIDFIKTPYFDLRHVTIMLNKTLQLDEDWLRFIDLSKRAGVRFELIYENGVKKRINHCNRVLELYKNNSVTTDNISTGQIIYTAYDFVKIVKDMEVLHTTFDKSQSDKVVINRFAKGCDFSDEQLDLFEKYNIKNFVNAPLTVYRMKKELARLECLLQLTEREPNGRIF